MNIQFLLGLAINGFVQWAFNVGIMEITQFFIPFDPVRHSMYSVCILGLIHVYFLLCFWIEGIC